MQPLINGLCVTVTFLPQIHYKSKLIIPRYKSVEIEYFDLYVWRNGYFISFLLCKNSWIASHTQLSYWYFE